MGRKKEKIPKQFFSVLKPGIKETEKTVKVFSDSFWFAPADVFLRATEKLIWSRVKLVSPVLDIGCGDTRLSRLLLDGHFPIGVGLDIDPLEIKRAQKTGLYRKLVVADAAYLPFKKRTFRTVISNCTFEHIKNDLKAVNEVARVLKSKGRFLLTVPTEKLEKNLKRIINNKESFKRFNQRVSHYYYHSFKEWQSILDKNGFLIKSYQFYFPPKAVKVWYQLFKIATFKPYHRELWSCLKDSFISLLMPRKALSWLLVKYLVPFYKGMFVAEGNWLFIEAQKIR